MPKHQWSEIIRINGKKYVELKEADKKVEGLLEVIEGIVHDYDHYGNVSKGLKLEIDGARKLLKG